MHVIRAACSLVLLAVLASPGQAASLNDWQQRAVGVVIKFEGSSYEAMTADFDCQGLTVGKGQWTVEGGSAKILFDDVARRMGEAPFAAFLGRLESQEGEASPRDTSLTAAIAAARQGNKAEALRVVRSWQQQKGATDWTALVEGDCGRSQTRSSEVRFAPDAAAVKRLRLFLRDETVAVSQEALLNHSADQALERAICWAKVVRGDTRPKFYEFLFFYDYLIQNGGRWVNESELFDVVARFDVEEGKPAQADRYMVAKMQQLRDWLMADFPYIRTAVPPGFLAHARYAADNAKAWFGLFEAGKLDKSQVKLLYVGLLRAMLGNNVYSYVAMNRRGTVVTGQGLVNNTPHDLAPLSAQSGDLDRAEISKAVARISSKVTQQFRSKAARVDVCRV